MKIPTVEYFACLNENLFPGVAKKINQTVASLNSNGYQAKTNFVKGGVLSKYIKLSFKIAFSKADIIIIRNNIGLVFCAPSILSARCRGIFVIIDNPTPLVTTVSELGSNGKKPSATIKKILFYFLFPLSFFPANRILQYSNESDYFSCGINNKSKIVANGINTSEIPIREKKSSATSDELVLLGVGSLGNWHGFDRIIFSIKKFNRNPFENRKIHFFIIGDGPAKQEWENLVFAEKLEDFVTFTGLKTGAELNTLFNKADIAIASLGLYRKGLELASDLKSREYTARGIPFICAGNDLDFDPTPAFVKKIANNDDEINLEEIIEWHAHLMADGIGPKEIRRYATENLDFKLKIKEIVSR